MSSDVRKIRLFHSQNARRSIVSQQASQGHPQRTRSRASYTAVSFLLIDPVDLPGRSLAHCGSETGCCWVPSKGGAAHARGGCRLASPGRDCCVWSRLYAFGNLTEDDRWGGARKLRCGEVRGTGIRPCRKMRLASMPQLHVHCGRLAKEGEPGAFLVSSEGGT